MKRPRSAEVSRLVSQELVKRGRNGQMSRKKKLAQRHIDQATVCKCKIGDAGTACPQKVFALLLTICRRNDKSNRDDLYLIASKNIFPCATLCTYFVPIAQ